MITNRPIGLIKNLLIFSLILITSSATCVGSILGGLPGTSTNAEDQPTITLSSMEQTETQDAQARAAVPPPGGGSPLPTQELQRAVDTPVTQKPSLTPEELQRAVDTLAPGTETLLYDNWHSEAACEFNNLAKFHLDLPAFVSKFDLWIFGQEKVKTLPFTLTDSSGATLPSGNVTNLGCHPDPAYKQYCQYTAVDFNRSLPAGDYLITLDNVKVCESAASGNTGYIKVWGK